MSVDLQPVIASEGSHGHVVSRPRRRADIQGLRAVAVILVVAFHAKLPVPGGFVGVDVFFVISGFVITAMLMREWAEHGRLRFLRFYFRRFLRLTPALALTVSFVVIASFLLQNPFGAQQTTARTGLGAMLLSANFAIAHAAGDYFATDTTTNPLLNTWSLSVEEQFYLLFPALFALAWTISRRTRRRLLPPLLLVAAIAVVSFAVSLAWTYGSSFAEGVTSYFGGPQSWAFYSPFSRAWEFAVGALLALGLPRIHRLSHRLAWAVGITGAVIVAASAFLIHDSMAFPGWIAVAPVFGTALVLLAGTWSTVGVSRALATRPMVAIGDASYSWYLWHWPVIVFAALLFPRDPLALIIAAVVSLVPAFLSYRFVEQPLRKLQPKTPGRATLVIVLTFGIPIVLATVLLIGSTVTWGLGPAVAYGTLTVTPIDHQATPTPAPPSATGAAPSSAASSPTATSAPTPSPSAEPVDPGQELTTAIQDGDVASGDGGSLRNQHLAVQNGCVNTDLDPASCIFGPADPVGTILLAGDSQAYAVADGVVPAAAAMGYDTIVTSHTGCPFLGRESSGTHNYPCRSWQKSIVDYALKERPAAVVISNRSAGYVHPEWQWRTAATDAGGAAGSVKEAASLWRKGLEPVISQLSDAGIPVIIIGAVPEMHGYTNGTSVVTQAFGNRDFDVPRDEAASDRQPAIDVETSLAKDYPGTFVYDPFPDLCDDTSCWAVKGDTIFYQDETHMSVEGAQRLTSGLTQTLKEAFATAPSPTPSASPTPPPLPLS